MTVFAGCAPAPVPPSQAVFRDQGAGIASSTRFEVVRFAGEWQVVAAFASADAKLAPMRLSLRDAGGAIEVVQGTAQMPVGRYSVTGPGRITRQGGPTFGPEVWVLWVDDGFRTAAIGTPDGRFGWIMDRSARGAPDRMTAAKEILRWQGYDMTKLREVAK